MINEINIHDIPGHAHCGNCFTIRCMNDFSAICPVIDCDHYCGASYHSCKQQEHELTCRNIEVPCINNKNGCPKFLPRWKSGLHLRSCPASVVLCRTCKHWFRRDEFDTHYRNFHNEISCSNESTLINKCPLASYGCNFTHEYFQPSNGNYFNTIPTSFLEGFGMKIPLDVSPARSTHPVIGASNDEIAQDITDTLPYVIWCEIIDYLDAYSLTNLSRVSRDMRDLCTEALVSRGMVNYVWERVETYGPTKHWNLTQQKKWTFSNSLSPIPGWVRTSCGVMNEHLKICPYNVKNDYAESQAVRLTENTDGVIFCNYGRHNVYMKKKLLAGVPGCVGGSFLAALMGRG